METNPFRLQPPQRARAAGGAASAPGRAESTSRGGSGPAPALPGRAAAWIRAVVAGKSWRLRAPLLPVLAWILWRYLQDREYRSIFDGLTLGFHEAGHAAFLWFGNDLLTTAGGTIFQVGIPLVAALYLLLRQRDPFGATVGTFWMGTALVGAGVYAADARAQALPLVSPFGPVDSSSHDWTVMLLRLGRISRDQEIGGALMNAGLLTMALSLALAVWVLRLMAGSASPRTGKALYDVGEEARLDTFLSGGTVERVAPRRLFKRAKGAGSPASAEGTTAAASEEEERFRRFLERDPDG